MTAEKKVAKIIIALIIILALSFLLLFIYQKVKYSEFYFIYNNFDVQKFKTATGYTYKIKVFLNNQPNPLLIGIRNDPRALESIPIETNLKNKAIKQQSFITMSQDASAISVVAATEISKILGNPYFFNVPIEGALIQPIEAKDVLVKTCEDVNDTTSIIYLKIGDKKQIYSENDCIIIEGKTEYDLIEAADRFILTLIGVMKDASV